MARDYRAGRKAIPTLAIALFLAAAALALPGCLGGDDDEVTTLTETVPPTVTDQAKDEKKKKKDKAQDGQAGGAAASGGACGGAGAVSKLVASGTSCGEARAVAKQWERMQDRCSTTDNPNSPSGYRRTCTVSGYKCVARRDTRSDRRFVTCTKGGAKIRFNFL